MSIHNLHLHGPLFTNYLRARRDVFILSKGWKLPEVDGMEFDQYDTPKARWIVAHDGDVVKGGVRIAPTTAQCGLHSYMIRDAQLGLLDGLPLDPLYFEAPVADHLWEGTRFFVAESVPAKERGEVQRMLLTDMAAAASAEGVRHVIGIVPAVFKRWMNRIGMDAYAVGPKFVLDGETSQAAMMNLTSIRASTEAAAAVQMPRAERAREFLNETFRRVAATL
ncbi:MAG: N-acyl-L-homoserine lactone synthetase [Limimaricola sp.]|nr:N-acyl-L-homoserine lactone synthetase [Limimaricola sp.]